MDSVLTFNFKSISVSNDGEAILVADSNELLKLVTAKINTSEIELSDVLKLCIPFIKNCDSESLSRVFPLNLYSELVYAYNQTSGGN